MFEEVLKSNDEKHKRFQEVELSLLGTSTLDELCRELDVNYRNNFKLDAISLTVFDESDELAEMYKDCEQPIMQFASRHVIDSLSLERNRSVALGSYFDSKHGYLFKGQASHLKSIALLPLDRRGNLIGILAIGSCDPERYSRKMHTDFLRRLAAIVSVCLENSCNHERVRQLGLRDPLTNLFNRRYFSEQLELELSKARRGNWPVSCLYLDIDYFKHINDTYGHAAGDAVLREVSRRIASQLRAGEILARMGGEEFAVLVPHASNKVGNVVAERIRYAVASEKYQLPEGDCINVSISCGVAEAQLVGGSNEQAIGDNLIQRADKALYDAKQMGRNRVVCATMG